LLNLKTAAFGGGHVLPSYAIISEEEAMANWKKAAHIVYQCSYRLIWTPKYQ
jgi:hypothetical protein